jgi:predicted ATPase
VGLQVATDLIDAFPGGVYFLALGPITDPGTVASTIAQVLGVRRTGGKPLAEALQDHLRVLVHAPILLFLDNFEHLLAAAPLVAGLLEACAWLRVLVTSRAVLHVYGEHEYPVLPLPLPKPRQMGLPEALSWNPAVTLFVERAAAVQAEFVLTEENATVVAQICCRLDGLPLAIELAAARLKMLPPPAVLARLQNRLELLTGGTMDMPARQQTLRKTIDWSHDLLNPAEQKLFRRLTVFAGGCTLEGAEAVCNAQRDLEIDVLEGMASLVDKSLVQQVGQKDGVARFAMLETIREYGLERLTASGENEVTKRAHAAYCMVLAEEGNPPLTTAERTNWLALCDTEHDNLRAALDWLIASENYEWASRLGLAFYWFWEPREHLAEGRELIEAILKMRRAQARTKERAKALTYAANFMANQGDYTSSFCLGREALDIYHELSDTKSIAGQLNSLGINSRSSGDYASARSWFEQSLQVCRELGDGRETAAALSNLAESVRAQGDPSLARALLEEALSLFRELGDAVGVAWSFNHLGDVARDRGDLEEARRLYQEGADALGKLGDRWGMAGSIVDLGSLACEQKDHATAQSLFEEALRTFLDLGHMRGVAKALEGFACLAAQQQNFEHALTLAGAAAALRHTMRAPARPDERAVLDRVLKPAWQHWDAAASKAIWTAGWKMLLEQAIQYALDRPHPKQASSIQS